MEPRNGTSALAAANGHAKPAPKLAVQLVSIVIPVYRGEQTLEALVTEIAPLSQETSTPKGRRFQVNEVILVHDGAVDRSDRVMEMLAERYGFVRLVWLSRNFGQHAATLAGMATTTGDWIVTLDEDGQHNPADSGRMLDEALSNAAQLVYARPLNTPPHGWFRNAMSHFAKWLFVKALGGAGIGPFHSFRLIDGEVGRSLAAYCGNRVYLDVALGWVVARRTDCPLYLRAESGRPSGYTLTKLAKHFLHLVLTSGTRPLRAIALLGVFAVLTALGISAWAIWQKVTAQLEVAGWASVVVLVCFFAGCILFSLGVIAEYLGVALSMSMGKPLYMVLARRPRQKAEDS
jgi:undecaprenyl-phosphate 4-deoxy-4-formamido-L-arabinose transferase